MNKKDDLPYMPFYVGDWLKATDIQVLPYELKGLWFEMLCYMWESKERGVLLYNEEELSRLLRLPEDLLKQKLKQLLKLAIYSVRESDGAIYSRRMVRDQGIRETRRKSGEKGGKASFASRFAQAKTQANADNDIDNEIDNENNNLINNITSANAELKTYFSKKELFEQIWKRYPRPLGKKAALRHFLASVSNEDLWRDVNTALDNYISFINKNQTAEKFIKYGSSWFNNWNDWLEVKTENELSKLNGFGEKL